MARVNTSLQMLFKRVPVFGRYKVVVGRSVTTFENMAEYCKAGRQRNREIKPQEYKQILAQDVRELFASNAMVAVLSYFDMKNLEWSELIHEVQKSNIHFHFLPNKIVHRALDNTPYVNICPLFISTNVVAFSETIQVKGLLQALKNQRKVQLLGGKIYNRLFANEGFSWVSKLPSLEQLHAELSVILSQPSQNISQLLVKNQQLLTQNLAMVASDCES